jgi:hypothetical protein
MSAELNTAIQEIIILDQMSRTDISATDIEAMKQALLERIHNMVITNQFEVNARKIQISQQMCIEQFQWIQNHIQRNRKRKVAAVKFISKQLLEENCQSECAICTNTPKHKNAILTECNHTYCHTCWNEWMKRSTNCPTCRMDMPRITSFKGRSTCKPAFIIEDSDEDTEVIHLIEEESEENIIEIIEV